ncbi:MAG: sigma-70 family RNA polymerase sigma factor [Candidatus Marinimicrobia bacterium]|nr:sigma-70 family RNA polymerase sigma factor [Candidatus Neomarinimicrobiota bacterium]
MTKEEKNNKYEFTDEELIAKFQNGDEGAFEELVHRYAGRLLNFVYRFVYDKKEAEDIVQDTFLRVYMNRHAYREIAKFSTWIYTIAANLAKTFLRKKKYRKVMFLSQMGPDENKDFEIKDEEEIRIIEKDMRVDEETIQRALLKLPEHFKTILILRDIQELSYEEISNILEIPIGTVKSRINRARLRLQKEISKILKGKR